MKPAITWISIIVGLLVLSVAIQGAYLVLALNDPSFAVEPDYESKARDWDAAQRERRNSVALGWSVDLRTSPAAPGEVELRLTLADDAGPIEDARVDVAGFHNARAGRVLEWSLPHEAAGVYRLVVPIRRSGIWEFRLAITRGDRRWTGKLRKSVVSVPRSPGAAR